MKTGKTYILDTNVLIHDPESIFNFQEHEVIVDESQNLTPHEMKTIISRAGEGSKIVLTGDTYQIDSPYLDSGSNGLSYLVSRFKGQPPFGHITVSETIRSPISSLAAELL